MSAPSRACRVLWRGAPRSAGWPAPTAVARQACRRAAHSGTVPTARARKSSTKWGNTALALGCTALAAYIISHRKPIAADADAPLDSNAAKRKIGRKELEQHNKKDDCWVAINGLIYDVTEFLEQHPGGAELILEHAGKDISKPFGHLHPKGTLEHTLSPFAIKGAVDPSSRPKETVQDQDEDEIEERRQALPPAASVLNLSTFERYAKQLLGEDSRAWVYISGWADDGVSFATTKDSYTHVRFLPRVGKPVADCNAATTLLGADSVLPVYISATGQNRAAHPDGEINSLRCAHKNGLIQMLSGGSSVSIQEMTEERARLAKEDGTKPATFWYQCYLRRKDRSRNIEDLQTAHAAKVDAIVLTLDAVALGNHEKNRNHPERLLAAGEIKDDMKGIKPLPMGTLDPDLSWKDIDWIKKYAPGIPVIVKGVLSVDDIELAYKHGASAVVLSNHGGRQLDYAPPPLAVLARTHMERPDLLKKIEVYIDGGITRGTDVLKALCLGAKGVGLGRVPFYAAACYGEEGITRAFQIMSDEIITGMRLLGCNRVSDLKPELLEIMPGLLGQQPSSYSYKQDNQ